MITANGEAIMLIVSDGDHLVVEAKIAPQDIDQLQLEQEATLASRLSINGPHQIMARSAASLPIRRPISVRGELLHDTDCT